MGDTFLVCVRLALCARAPYVPFVISIEKEKKASGPTRRGPVARGRRQSPKCKELSRQRVTARTARSEGETLVSRL